MKVENALLFEEIRISQFSKWTSLDDTLKEKSYFPQKGFKKKKNSWKFKLYDKIWGLVKSFWLEKFAVKRKIKRKRENSLRERIFSIWKSKEVDLFIFLISYFLFVCCFFLFFSLFISSTFEVYRVKRKIFKNFISR